MVPNGDLEIKNVFTGTGTIWQFSRDDGADVSVDAYMYHICSSWFSLKPGATQESSGKFPFSSHYYVVCQTLQSIMPDEKKGSFH